MKAAPLRKAVKDHCKQVRCITCIKEVEDDTILCQWCSKWEHRLCAGVSAKEYDLLSNSCSKIMFFCSLCCPKVPLVLKIDDANHSVSSNYETLREAITDLSTEIKNLKSSDNELQKNIKETTAALSTINTMYPPANGVPATSSSVAMNVVKELEDKEHRKKNFIFYNVSEPVKPSWKVDSEYITIFLNTLLI